MDSIACKTYRNYFTELAFELRYDLQLSNFYSNRILCYFLRSGIHKILVHVGCDSSVCLLDSFLPYFTTPCIDESLKRFNHFDVEIVHNGVVKRWISDKHSFKGDTAALSVINKIAS